MNNIHTTNYIRNIFGAASSYCLLHKYEGNYKKCCGCICCPWSCLFAKEATGTRRLNVSTLKYTDAASDKIVNHSIYKQKIHHYKKNYFALKSRLTKLERSDNIHSNDQNINLSKNIDGANQPNRSGLLYYRKWWERLNVEISVNGTIIEGVPIFTEENTLRVINKNNNFFIPLEKVDYIRTADGLSTCAFSDVNPVIGSARILNT